MSKHKVNATFQRKKEESQKKEIRALSKMLVDTDSQNQYPLELGASATKISVDAEEDQYPLELGASASDVLDIIGIDDVVKPAIPLKKKAPAKIIRRGPRGPYGPRKNKTVPEPIVPEPIVPEPVVPEPIVPEPIVPEPIVPEPVVPEPIVHEPMSIRERIIFLDNMSKLLLLFAIAEIVMSILIFINNPMDQCADSHSLKERRL